MKLSTIVSALKARLENGAPDAEIIGLNGVEQAGSEEITFVANPKYAAAARRTKAAAVIVAENFPVIPAATLRVEDPYLAFARALSNFSINHFSMLLECMARPSSTPRARSDATLTSVHMW